MNLRYIRTGARAPVIIMLVAGATLGLAGCTVGPDYKSPDIDTPAAFSQQAAAPEGSGDSKPITIAWWSTFNDPILTSLVERSIAANLDLRIAASRITQARAQRRIAASAGLPRVGSSGAYSRSRDSENTRNGRFVEESSSGSDNYRISLDASWELDIFGGIKRSIEAAEAEVQTFEEARRDVLVMIVAEVANNYVLLRGTQRQIEVTRENIRVQDETLKLSRSRFEAGLTSELDVAQATAQLATTRAELPTLEADARQAIHSIGVLLGQAPGTQLESLLVPAPIPQPEGPAFTSGGAPYTIPVGLPSELLRRRPDVRRAERQIAAASARIGVATSDLYPKFSLTGDLGLSAGQFGSLFQGNSRFWSIGPGVSWPIFRGGEIRSNIALQEALTDEAIANYERTVLGALQDVEDALVDFDREQVRRALLSNAVDANKRAVELSNQLYRSGLTDFQRVLDSQRSLFLSQASLAISEQRVSQALVRVYKSLGGGWEEPAQP